MADIMFNLEKASRGQMNSTKNLNFLVKNSEIAGRNCVNGGLESKNLSQISTNPNSAAIAKQVIVEKPWERVPTLGDLKRQKENRQDGKSLENNLDGVGHLRSGKKIMVRE